MAGAAGDGPPPGVTVCVRLRPMFVTRPDGTPAREATCQRVVEMEGRSERGVGSAVVKITDPNNPTAKPREYAFDRSYWSCDGFKEDPERPGVCIPDSSDSKYVSQDMVWSDIGEMIMKNALSGYNCTVFAYGQSGAGKSYSVVGYPPNIGLIPKTVQYLYNIVDANTDPNIRYQLEIAMLEVYMDEVYDLLEPRKKERDKLRVFVNKGEVFVYDPKDRKNMDKIWRAARDLKQAEAFRHLGDANRTVRATGMNPSSSRGHTIFTVRFRKEAKLGDAWVEQLRSKISLVDLAGSERAHDTGLTGIGLEEGVAINQSLTALGQVLVSLCKGERVNYRDKLTQLLAESLSGTAVTVMIAALSPADINYNDTISTLRFADNAKKMPVKIVKQLDPTSQLIADLKSENEKLKAQLSTIGAGGSTLEANAEKEEYDRKLREAEEKLNEMEKAYQLMEAKAKEGGRLRIRVLPLRLEDSTKIQAKDDEIAVLRGELSRLDAAHEQHLEESARLQVLVDERKQLEMEAQQAAAEAQKAARNELEIKAAEMASLRHESDQRSAAINDEMVQIRSALQLLTSQGSEATEERRRLEELLKAKELQEEERRINFAEEKAAIETLLEARITEIEGLIREIEEARKAASLSSQQGAADAAERWQRLHALEEALTATREDYHSMEQRANDVGAEARFRASELSIQKQLHESTARSIHEEVERLRVTSDPLDAEASRRLVDLIQQEQAATLAAHKIGEELRLAAEVALQERMGELQAVMRDRDQAREDAMEVRQRLGPAEAELKEKHEAIEAILRQQQESWEEKLARSDRAEINLRKTFEDMGLSVAEIVGLHRGDGDAGENVPHFVNLCEDAHEEGLVYLIPAGTSKVKKYVEGDDEPAIKLCGPSIRAHHATLCYDASTCEVSLASGEEGAVIWVNGFAVTRDATRLEHGSRVIFGNDFVFRYVDPRVKKAKRPAFDDRGMPVVVDWQYAMDELAKRNGVDVEAKVEEVRERLQANFARREAELAEEQRILEERIAREREAYEKDILELRNSAADPAAFAGRQAAQERTEAALAKFQGQIAAKRTRAQWVRAVYRSKAEGRFELDVRLARQQMATLQSRLVEANRISVKYQKNVIYSFHFLDAIDPRERSTDADKYNYAGKAAGATFAAGVTGAVIGGVVGAVFAGPPGAAAGIGCGAQLGTVAASAVGVSAVGAAAVGTAVLMSSDDDDEGLQPKRLLLQIKAEHQATGSVQLWPQQKFMDRFVRMICFANGEALDTFFDEEDARYEDIFWDEMDHTLIGMTAVGLTPLLRMQDVRETVTLRGPTGLVTGALVISMSMKTNQSATSLKKGDSKALVGKTVKGEVKFGRLTNVGDSWSGLFVRFSWFDSHGRLTNESPVVESSDIGYCFMFEQMCTEAFSDFLDKGAIVLQVRAYEKGKVKDLELRNLRLKLRRAEADLSALRARMESQPNGFPVPQASSAGASLEVELAKARDDAAQARRETDDVKRELELLRQQKQRTGPTGEETGGTSAMQKRIAELEEQLRTSQATHTQSKKSSACAMM